MTDAEIIKALECCGTYKGKCTDCPAFVSIDRSNCKKVLLGAAEIITRQQAEIERLRNDVAIARKETKRYGTQLLMIPRLNIPWEEMVGDGND